jgi:hypothetical protein
MQQLNPAPTAKQRLGAVRMMFDCLASDGVILFNPETAMRGVIMTPKEAAISRLVGAILLEQNDEWSIPRTRHMTPATLTIASDDPLASLPAAAA